MRRIKDVLSNGRRHLSYRPISKIGRSADARRETYGPLVCSTRAVRDGLVVMHLLERQEQLDTLNRCLQEARARVGKMVLVAAEAGYGKSSLIERFTLEHRRDARALWGACDSLATPSALAPVHEIAAQTSLIPNAAGAGSASRDWLFHALFDELADSQQPSIVVLEDVHWADEATLDFLRFLGRRIQRTRALFIATYRLDEVSANDPLRQALGDLTGHHVTRMRLPPLSAAAVALLAQESGRDAARLH